MAPQTRAWYKVHKRQSFIKAHELTLRYKEVVNIQNPVLRDYLLLLLFTSLRREEVMTLWSLFMLHDLRRTFITIAKSLDISAYAVKCLVNHKMNHDVTAGYLATDVERLRKPMQQITNYIAGQIGLAQLRFIVKDMNKNQP